MSATPLLPFGLVPLTGSGFPTENDSSYQLMFDQAVSGGPGTSAYLTQMLKFASFTSYLNTAGNSAFTQSQMPDGSMEAVATDGTTTMNIGVQLNSGLEQTDVDGIPVRGIASVRMALPAPRELAKIMSFGLSLAEIPAGIVVTNTLIQSLFKPLLQQLTDYVSTTVDNWLSIDVGEDIAGLGDDVAAAAGDAAEEIGSETAEVVVEEAVVAEVAIDLSAAVPAFAVLGLLVAVPLLISALSKQFELHLEIDNQTDHDFTWSLPYQYNGGMTAQPAQTLLPKMGRATDSWGDETNIPVVFQANFSSMNKSGYSGTGFAMLLSTSDFAGQDIAAVISIPWLADNALYLGDVTPGMNWEDTFNNLPTPALRVTHGNQRFYTTLAIDALSGNHDVYHCVLRIQPL